MMLRYGTTLKRMLEFGNLKNTTQLASVLGITPQALSNYKRNGKMPVKLVFKFADLYDVSMDRLVAEEIEFKSSENDNEANAAMAQELLAGNGTIKEYNLSEEERIYVDKLLYILRGNNETFKNVIMLGLDLEYRKEEV